MPDSLDLPLLRLALARLAKARARVDLVDAHPLSAAGGTFWAVAKALPAAELLAALGEVDRLREACRRAIIALEGPNPGICDTIWADHATTLVDLLTAALSAPAPDGEARPDGPEE